MAEQTQFKTRNQVFNDFITISKSALETFNITGWEVRQLMQVFKVNILKPTVFISVLSTDQLGRQYNSKALYEGQINKTNLAKQEVNIRFSATRREVISDILGTYNGADIVKVIKNYIQSSEGIKQLASMGYAQYRSGEITDQNFLNDDENFQFLPYFDCTFLYTDSFTTNVNKISNIKEKGIYRV